MQPWTRNLGTPSSTCLQAAINPRLTVLYSVQASLGFLPSYPTEPNKSRSDLTCVATTSVVSRLCHLKSCSHLRCSSESQLSINERGRNARVSLPTLDAEALCHSLAQAEAATKPIWHQTSVGFVCMESECGMKPRASSRSYDLEIEGRRGGWGWVRQL